MQPAVKAFFDQATFTFSYVVRDPRSTRCAIIDPVLDYDPKSGRASTRSADAIIDLVGGVLEEVAKRRAERAAAAAENPNAAPPAPRRGRLLRRIAPPPPPPSPPAPAAPATP